MSKTIDDYRNIIKILKLQLLKIREDNATLSHTLGIASSEEHSCKLHQMQPSVPKYKSITNLKNHLLKIFWPSSTLAIGVS